MVDPLIEASYNIRRVVGGVSFSERSILPLADLGFIRYYPSIFDRYLNEAHRGLKLQLAEEGSGLVTTAEGCSLRCSR